MNVPNPQFTIEELDRLEQSAAYFAPKQATMEVSVIQVQRLVAAARLTLQEQTEKTEDES